MLRKILLAGFIVILFGCSKHNSKPDLVYDVPDEFGYIVNNFIHEAALRGHNITIKYLIIRYDSTLDNSFCAQSNVISTDPDIQKIISVNSNVQCWTNDAELETLIFHELGHCVLGRTHDDELMPNHDPRSIMIENNLNLYSPCAYPLGGSCQDNSFKRSYYLSELFDKNTPIPDWAK